VRQAGRASLGRVGIRRPASAALAAVLLGLFVSGPVGADTKTELEAAKERLSALQAETNAVQAEAARLGSQLSSLASEISRMQGQIQVTKAKIGETESDIATAERRIARLEARLALRARDVYIRGPGGIFEVVFGSSSIADLSERMALYDRVQQQDADLALSIHAQKVELQRQKADLEVIKADQVATTESLQARRAELDAAFDRQLELERELDRKQAEVGGLVKELTAKRAAEIRAAALALQAQLRGGAVDTSGAFKVCPVDQPRAYSDDFGAPRYTGGYHPHQGNDIFAPAGTPIRAPFDGTAANASNSIGGLSVKVFGAPGYVYNAHLSRFGQLGSVSAGDVIGYVGNTGNARTTPPHDHFEFHPGGGSAVSPYGYLNAVC
jgi:murein DD-endopeptidase MepM/ murein hydrolase activator NlpD